MRRRDFITLLGGTALTWPLAARAQQPVMPVIGFLGSDSADLYMDRLRALRDGLKQTGYTEGQNVAVEYRWAEGHNDRLPAVAADLVRRRVAVLVASTTPSVLALKAATKDIPIVFFVAGDPVALGLVASLNRPGGNLTGATTMTLEVGSKWLQLLHEIVPAARDFAVLVNPTNPALAKTQANDLEAAARALGLQLHVLQASTDSDFDTVFANLSQLKAGGLVISSDSFFLQPQRTPCCPSDKPRSPGGLWLLRISEGWRFNELRRECDGAGSYDRRLRRPHSQRREASRPTSRTGK